MARYTTWRRKPKIKDLDEGLSTKMTFAVVGSAEKFKSRFHAYKVYQLFRELGVKVYPIAAELEKLDKDKVYPNLLSLPEPVDAVIPCLPSEFSLSIVQEAQEAGIKTIWFQTNTLSKEAYEFCNENELTIIEGCALRYRDFSGITRFFHPCYWHNKTISRKQNKL